MASLVIAGDSSGQITLAAPAVAGTNTATLPVATGELSMLGTSGQTWQNVTASRALSTTYTNSTGKPIQLYIVASAGNSNGAAVTINGVTPAFVYANVAGGRAALFPIIPNGATYLLGDASATIQSWWELR